MTPEGECCPKCVRSSPALPALCVLEGGQVMVEGETRQQEADPCTTWYVHVHECVCRHNLYVYIVYNVYNMYTMIVCSTCT